MWEMGMPQAISVKYDWIGDSLFFGNILSQI